MSASNLARFDPTLPSLADTGLLDYKRYRRHAEGESISDIAAADGINRKLAQESVTRGQKMFEGEQLLKLKTMKYQGAIDNETIRTEVRRRIADKIAGKIEDLLSGQRPIVEINKITGEVTIKMVIDPEVVALGLEHARKTISLDEKPAAGQTVVNIQNNQTNVSEGQAERESSYEERLQRIRSRQVSSREVIEVPAQEVRDTEPDSAVDAEFVPEIKGQEEAWQF